TQKADLEIIVQTIMEHGDVVDHQWHEKFIVATQLADLDGLTQIPNRRRFDTYFAQQWQTNLDQQTPLSLLLCDIDHFKAYNDAYGHLAGDDCLRQIAKVLHQSMTRPDDLVARYGGEEFVILLPRTDQAGARQVAERVRDAIAHLQLPHDGSLVSPHVTLSMGLASAVPTAHFSPDHLLTAADQHLYFAKQRGKNQVVVGSVEGVTG
ncbi:MAG: diguanylate cyclase, partial [Leptolyngbya sp.]|nr:diguanylate cyclase [Leptolyngbya sp.]